MKKISFALVLIILLSLPMNVFASELDTDKNVTVRIEDLYNGVTVIPETELTLNGTHMDALKAVLSVYGEEQDIVSVDSYGYINSILDIAGDGLTTSWMYALNGGIPVKILSEIPVEEGDSLVLFFINWYDLIYLTEFNEKEVSLETGETLELTLSGIDSILAMDGESLYSPLSGVTVFAVDEHGNRTDAEALSDENGRIDITFTSAGKYIVSAERAGSFNVSDVIPPMCIVYVKEEYGENITGEYMSRGMLVNMLYNLENSPFVIINVLFDDIYEGHLYTEAVIWAYQNGIASGYDNGLFGVDDHLTIEQTFVILRNYAKWKKYDISQASDISQYADAEEVSFWAVDAVEWAQATGFIKSGSSINPKSLISGAETIEILTKFLDVN